MSIILQFKKEKRKPEENLKGEVRQGAGGEGQEARKGMELLSYCKN